MHPGIYSGCKYTRATSDACSVKRRDRARIKNTSGFYDSTRLMRASNWNSARATTDDVSRVHEQTSTHKYANWETAQGSVLMLLLKWLLCLRPGVPQSRWLGRDWCSSLWQAIPARKLHNLDGYHHHYAVKNAVKCRKTQYFTPSCAKKRRFLRRNGAFQERA